MSKHSSPHDWLNLVQLSGLLVSEPVLATAFPDGRSYALYTAKTRRTLRKTLKNIAYFVPLR
jgi:hypothetical protein